MADLRLRLQGREEQELAARSEARRLARELAIARRLLKYSGAGPQPARLTPPPLPAASPVENAQTPMAPRQRAALLTDRVAFHIDSCVDRGTYTAIAGWAFRPAPDWEARATTVTLLFRHGATVYHAPAARVPRPDVAAHFATQPRELAGGARDLDGVGFSCEILRDSLPAGVDLAIALRLEYAGLACEQPTGTFLRL